MKRNLIKGNSKSNIIMSFLLIIFIGLGCGLIKNPLRDYSPKPFNSKDWIEGDSVERGRMVRDLVSKRLLSGKSREEVVDLLGIPYKKKTIEKREVWLYRVDFSSQTAMKYFPVSFDGKLGAFAGRDKGGTRSILIQDE